MKLKKRVYIQLIESIDISVKTALSYSTIIMPPVRGGDVRDRRKDEQANQPSIQHSYLCLKMKSDKH